MKIGDTLCEIQIEDHIDFSKVLTGCCIVPDITILLTIDKGSIYYSIKKN